MPATGTVRSSDLGLGPEVLDLGSGSIDHELERSAEVGPRALQAIDGDVERREPATVVLGDALADLVVHQGAPLVPLEDQEAARVR